MTWERAIAESDNLVFYGLAKELGEQKLAQAAAALSMTPATSNEKLAYALSFGTFGATPRALIGAAQAMAIVAYGIPVDSPAPHALGHRRTTANPAIAAIKKLLPHQAQRDALRELMSAPVRLDGGTLAYLRDTISAGKSGTVQSVMLAPNGRHYNHGKWNITYQHPQRALNLYCLSSAKRAVGTARIRLCSPFAGAHATFKNGLSNDSLAQYVIWSNERYLRASTRFSFAHTRHHGAGNWRWISKIFWLDSGYYDGPRAQFCILSTGKNGLGAYGFCIP